MKTFLKNKSKRTIIGLAALSLVIGLSPMIAQAATNGQAPIQPDKEYFKKLGWVVEANSSPDMACNDTSLSRALRNGIKLGIYQGIPFFNIQSGAETTGIDWDINMAVFKYLGITNVKSVILQWPEMVPSLLSKRSMLLVEIFTVTQDAIRTLPSQHQRGGMPLLLWQQRKPQGN